MLIEIVELCALNLKKNIKIDFDWSHIELRKFESKWNESEKKEAKKKSFNTNWERPQWDWTSFKIFFLNKYKIHIYKNPKWNEEERSELSKEKC